MSIYDVIASASTTQAINISSFISLPQQALWRFRVRNMSILHSQLPFITWDHHAVCDVYHFARHRNLPYNVSSNKYLRPHDELLHSDIWVPITVSSMHGHKYFLTALDDFSRFTWIILFKSKSEAREQVQIKQNLLKINIKFTLQNLMIFHWILWTNTKNFENLWFTFRNVNFFESCDESERQFYIRFKSNFILYKLDILLAQLERLMSK